MKKRILSVFIDESGDFGAYQSQVPFYLITLLFHDQDDDIQGNVLHLRQNLERTGFLKHAIHTGPLIRRETPAYANEPRERRKKMFNLLYQFQRIAPLHYLTVAIHKRLNENRVDIQGRLAHELGNELRARMNFFSRFDEMIVYYDNGQNYLTSVLVSVFNSIFSNVTFRKVQPKDYVLFQCADFLCTMELIWRKFKAGHISKSEKDFFGDERSFRKDYWKTIQKKRLLES